MEYYFEKKESNIEQIVQATFPRYTGRSIRLSTEIPEELYSYWAGGSKDSYAFYQLETGKVLPVKDNHPVFEAGNPSHLGGVLPSGIILVEHSYFCGQDMGITIYVNQTDILPLLPPPIDQVITDQEATVLLYTKSYISSARYDYALRKTGISREEWDQAKLSLEEKKLLTRSGAVTPKGRNYLLQHGLELDG